MLVLQKRPPALYTPECLRLATFSFPMEPVSSPLLMFSMVMGALLRASMVQHASMLLGPCLRARPHSPRTFLRLNVTVSLSR